MIRCWDISNKIIKLSLQACFRRNWWFDMANELLRKLSIIFTFWIFQNLSINYQIFSYFVITLIRTELSKSFGHYRNKKNSSHAFLLTHNFFLDFIRRKEDKKQADVCEISFCLVICGLGNFWALSSQQFAVSSS